MGKPKKVKNGQKKIKLHRKSEKTKKTEKVKKSIFRIRKS